MEQDARDYSNNDINVTSESTVHITLCLRGALHLTPEDMSPPSSRPFLSKTTAYAERPVETARFNACQGRFRDYGEFQERSTSETLNHTVSYQSSLPTEEEIPTFIFGRPFVGQTTPMPPHPRVAANRYQTPVPWICEGHAANRSEEESETEYNPATKAHFRQHLGIIDCSKAPDFQDRKWLEGRSSALQDYETQLRLLEQQNREHVMKARACNTRMPKHGSERSGEAVSRFNGGRG